jgi:hypothetical protein
MLGGGGCSAQWLEQAKREAHLFAHIRAGLGFENGLEIKDDEYQMRLGDEGLEPSLHCDSARMIFGDHSGQILQTELQFFQFFNDRHSNHHFVGWRQCRSCGVQQERPPESKCNISAVRHPVALRTLA